MKERESDWGALCCNIVRSRCARDAKLLLFLSPCPSPPPAEAVHRHKGERKKTIGREPRAVT